MQTDNLLKPHQANTANGRWCWGVGARIRVYHGGLLLLGVTENMSFIKATPTPTQELCSQACWESQAPLCKEPQSCHFLRKLTRKNQVGRIRDWYLMLGPSTPLRDPTTSVCTPSYTLIHLADMERTARKSITTKESRISMKTGSPTSPR